MAYVTDHAVFRYLERHYGIDIEAIREEMNVPGIEKAAEFGCGTVKLPNGMRLRLNGNAVITCVPPVTRRR